MGGNPITLCCKLKHVCFKKKEKKKRKKKETDRLIYTADPTNTADLKSTADPFSRSTLGKGIANSRSTDLLSRAKQHGRSNQPIQTDRSIPGTRPICLPDLHSGIFCRIQDRPIHTAVPISTVDPNNTADPDDRASLGFFA